MTPSLYAKLHDAINAVVASEDEERAFFVYETLVQDMTKAAAGIYDVCQKASEFAYEQATD